MRIIAQHRVDHKKAGEEMASACQDFLRRCIRRILEAEPDLRTPFSGASAPDKADEFLNTLVYFGDYERALAHWRSKGGSS